VQSKINFHEIAKLHQEAINQGFLSSLGLSFLSLLYESIDKCPSGILVVEKDQGKIIGFASGTLGTVSIYKILLKSWFRLSLCLVPQLLCFSKIYKILEILLLSKKRKKDQVKTELLSIAVLPSYRGLGLAQKLYTSICNEFSKSDANSFSIVVGNELDRALNFYKKMGAERVHEIEVHRGSKSTVLHQKLPLSKQI
jgi:ribosomal protein S18 acetylase RimI-like enzyme